jgi:hypothetical protein
MTRYMYLQRASSNASSTAKGRAQTILQLNLVQDSKPPVSNRLVPQPSLHQRDVAHASESGGQRGVGGGTSSGNHKKRRFAEERRVLQDLATTEELPRHLIHI